MNPFRWIADWIGFVRFVREMNRTDAAGRKSGFLYHSDKPDVGDYLGLPPFGNTVFVSFERHSLPLAERFERSLRDVGVTPWRYEPPLTGDVPEPSAESLSAAIEGYDRQNPGELQKLEATLRRCSAVLFLVSRASLRSAFCEIEAWTTGIIHGYGDPKNAAVYVVLEEPELEPPVFIQKFWRKTYETGLEEGLAVVIASEIEMQAARLASVERHRQALYR